MFPELTIHHALPVIRDQQQHLRQDGQPAQPQSVFRLFPISPSGVMGFNAPHVDILTPNSRTALTSGGSSGGESALIAVHGSPWGIGTDIGGSIVGFPRKIPSLREIILHPTL